jgi:hypothetical protein
MEVYYDRKNNWKKMIFGTIVVLMSLSFLGLLFLFIGGKITKLNKNFDVWWKANIIDKDPEE